MKITRRNLKILIESFLNEEELKPITKMFSIKKMIGKGAYLASARDFPFLVKGGAESSYDTLADDAKNLIFLISAVYASDIKNVVDYSKASRINVFEPTSSIYKSTRDTFIVTSGQRSGADQVNALKVNLENNSDEYVISMYSPDNQFGDPFMTDETKEAATKAVKLIRNGEDEKAGKHLDKNPISAHFTNMAIDFRGSEGRAEEVMKACKYIIDNGLASFHYQEELPGENNHHIHVGPLDKDQTKYLTDKGMKRFQEILDALEGPKSKNIGDVDSEDDIPFEQMP